MTKISGIFHKIDNYNNKLFENYIENDIFIQ